MDFPITWGGQNHNRPSKIIIFTSRITVPIFTAHVRGNSLFILKRVISRNLRVEDGGANENFPWIKFRDKTVLLERADLRAGDTAPGVSAVVGGHDRFHYFWNSWRTAFENEKRDGRPTGRSVRNAFSRRSVPSHATRRSRPARPNVYFSTPLPPGPVDGRAFRVRTPLLFLPPVYVRCQF